VSGTLRYPALALAFFAMLAALMPTQPAAEAARDTESRAPPPSTGATPALVLRCATEAFGMDFTPFRKTDGNIRITISASDTASKWHVEPLGEGHVASIASLLRTSCQNGCPYTRDDKGAYQLWAPVPKSLQALGESETLTIAVVSADHRTIKISTFRGRDIVALEKGECLAGEPAQLPSESGGNARSDGTGRSDTGPAPAGAPTVEKP